MYVLCIINYLFMYALQVRLFVSYAKLLNKYVLGSLSLIRLSQSESSRCITELIFIYLSTRHSIGHFALNPRPIFDVLNADWLAFFLLWCIINSLYGACLALYPVCKDARKDIRGRAIPVNAGFNKRCFA